MYPENLRYTKQHEWVEVQESNLARIGITDYAQHELGDIVFVELPGIDDELEQGEALGVVESVKAVSDVYMPIGGKVKEINKELENQPELINQSPHEEGWLTTVEMTDEEELSTLMTAEEYEEFVSELSEKDGEKKKKKQKAKANVRASDDEDEDEDDDELDGYTEEDSESHDGEDEAGGTTDRQARRYERDDF